METFSKEDEPRPELPPYLLPDESHKKQDARIYHIPPPSPPLSTFPPEVDCTTEPHSPLTGSEPPPSTPRLTFVNYESELFCYPALTTCPYCQTQVTTQVTYRVGGFVWLMCLVFVLCGLVLGCCLIPFFFNYFKDTCHACPRCQRVLHVHKRTRCG